ncbi:hypothetical protein SPOG_01824 [Schizosaccharomyces cryophilus OY26]|uniref:Uncharacterized protein n=1 Tax=Schizosaccharomyces cryophilus (strain OY26 / ATCC MYA-4695 / CBS 11777 / NBRC 106824 / NRRL Y48691) TaxID=653667 RepID=S9X5Y3_SCHCR|nr:uncharacterized protein SPOG_01824 [Schizosaccharomyces cryophilus OY26]EPY52502.1 hypothetical protein SPOG_01824 [Schizosaccharomyces cryophilus OY26]
MSETRITKPNQSKLKDEEELAISKSVQQVQITTLNQSSGKISNAEDETPNQGLHTSLSNQRLGYCGIKVLFDQIKEHKHVPSSLLETTTPEPLQLPSTVDALYNILPSIEVARILTGLFIESFDIILDIVPRNRVERI